MKKLLVIFFWACSLRLSAQPVQLDSAKTLAEVVVTYRAGEESPVTFQNLAGSEIGRRYMGQEPSFLLAETPSATNYSDAGSAWGYSYFRLRGIDQTRINLTLDGVPLNEPEDQGAYFSNYPDLLNSVSSIQLQRGVGTSKNGSASYAGSIELFSPQLRDSAYTTVGAGYGSFNSLRAFGEFNSGVRNRKALYARVSQVYSDGYKYHSSNNARSLFLSGGLFGDRSVWKFNLLAGQQRNQLAWLGVADTLIRQDRRTNANSRQEKDNFSQVLLQVQHSWRVSTASHLQSSVYYTYLNGGYDFDLNNFLGLPSSAELFRYAFRSNFIGFFVNHALSKSRLEWANGIHANAYDRRHTGSESQMGQLYQNTGLKKEVSAFSKVSYALGPLTLFADLQFRSVGFDYRGQVQMPPLNWHFLNPKAGISARAGAGTTLYYSIGRTGREPTRNDMFGGQDDLLGDDEGNPLLFNTDPEYVTDHELGVRHRLGRLEVDANLFFMDFQNEIVLNGKFGPNGLALTNNVENSIRTGIEWRIAYPFAKYFSLVNQSAVQHSRIREQEATFEPILSPPVIVNQELQYQRGRLAVALSGRYQHGAFIDFANSNRLKGYFLLNARTNYQVGRFVFSIFLNNINNAAYFNQGYVDFDGSAKYFVQAPFNLFTAVNIRL